MVFERIKLTVYLQRRTADGWKSSASKARNFYDVPIGQTVGPVKASMACDAPLTSQRFRTKEKVQYFSDAPNGWTLEYTVAYTGDSKTLNC